ncbi:MAG: hypothetical protein ACTHNW_16765 [Mucilaginibacter sp.]
MNNKNTPRPQLRLVAAGLLLAAVPSLVNDWIHIPDFVRGILVGVGIGLEIIGLIRMSRRRKAGAA